MGQVTLKLLPLSKMQSITLNADATDGKIHVELLDSDGYRVEGYTREDALPITGNGLRHLVKWQDRSLVDLPKGDYRMRIHLNQASLFAVDLVDE